MAEKYIARKREKPSFSTLEVFDQNLVSLSEFTAKPVITRYKEQTHDEKDRERAEKFLLWVANECPERRKIMFANWNAFDQRSVERLVNGAPPAVRPHVIDLLRTDRVQNPLEKDKETWKSLLYAVVKQYPEYGEQVMELFRCNGENKELPKCLDRSVAGMVRILRENAKGDEVFLKGRVNDALVGLFFFVRPIEPPTPLTAEHAQRILAACGELGKVNGLPEDTKRNADELAKCLREDFPQAASLSA